MSRGRVLALLLVGTLLLCHGVFGVVHLCSTPTAHTHQTHEHTSFADETVIDHEQQVSHLTGAEYFAVLFTALAGLVLGMLVKGARSWSHIASFRSSERHLPPFFFHSQRGGPLKLPILQVFRL
jgi:hypothetical protein